MRRSWDRRAWKDARPDKIVPTDGAEMVAHWNQQLHDLGYHDPSPQPGLPMVVGAPRVGAFDRDAAVETILVRLGARRSAWNPADIRGEAEKAIAAAGLVVDQAVRTELAEDLTARAIEACVPLLDQPGVPEHVRSLTSTHVLSVEADIVTRLASRADVPVAPAVLSASQAEGLDDLQRTAVAALAGQAGLVVIEGAAGAGKTTSLAATKSGPERAGPPDAGGDPDLEGRPGRGPRGRHRGFGGLADPPARLPMGRGRPLDPPRPGRAGARGGAGRS